jgi:hypothetical protein
MCALVSGCDAAGAGAADRVPPQHAGKGAAAVLVFEEGGDAHLAFAEDQGAQVAHPWVGQDAVGHGLGVVAANHQRDAGVEVRGDLRRHLVGGSEEVHAGPARFRRVDDLRGFPDSQAVRFGVEDATLKPACWA